MFKLRFAVEFRMRGRVSLSRDARWVSASDLAEHAYCPRALWYHYHPPPEGAAPGSVRSRDEGVRFHQRSLRERDRRERWAPLAWMLLALGVALLGIVIGLGWVV